MNHHKNHFLAENFFFILIMNRLSYLVLNNLQFYDEYSLGYTTLTQMFRKDTKDLNNITMIQ